MKQKIPFYDTAACSAMHRSPCVLWTVHLLGHIALNNLSKFGCPDGITGGSHLADPARSPQQFVSSNSSPSSLGR